MKERPILFKGEMVRAIREGRKTQTRRIFKGLIPPGCPGKHSCRVEAGFAKFHLNGKLAMHSGEWTRNPYGQPGDRLWVKETFRLSVPAHEGQTGYPIYRADFESPPAGLWKPSIFMPRWASRITLEIVRIRVERLQDISAADAQAEGIKKVSTARLSYCALWESINGKGSWAKNPWVWVIEFKRL